MHNNNGAFVFILAVVILAFLISFPFIRHCIYVSRLKVEKKDNASSALEDGLYKKGLFALVGLMICVTGLWFLYNSWPGFFSFFAREISLPIWAILFATIYCQRRWSRNQEAWYLRVSTLREELEGPYWTHSDYLGDRPKNSNSMIDDHNRTMVSLFGQPYLDSIRKKRSVRAEAS